jgi:hypothetical protein
MNKTEIKKLVGGTIFSAIFTKKNGDKRKMHCRLGVVKHLKGGVKKYDNDTLLTVFDLKNKAYRTINLLTLEQLNFKGKEIKL